jgi:hypothetical protein
MQQKRRSDWKRYEKIAIRLESGFLNKRFVNVTMVDVVFCFLFFLLTFDSCFRQEILRNQE